MTIFFTSCPPEKEDPSIVGTWRVTSVDGYNLCDGKEESDTRYATDYDWLWTFDKDGKLIEYINDGCEVIRHKYDYQVREKKLWIDGWFGDDLPSYVETSIKITNLTEDKLQLVCEFEDAVGNQDYEYDYWKWIYNFTREY